MDSPKAQKQEIDEHITKNENTQASIKVEEAVALSEQAKITTKKSSIEIP